MLPKAEREFLIRLAPIYLACRYRLMGGSLIGKAWPMSNMAFDFLGMRDYEAEMRLLCAEHLERPVERRSDSPRA